MKLLRLIKINTTAWAEEDLMIETNLSSRQIKSVIRPIVMAERDCNRGKNWYDNNTLVTALKTTFPDKVINPITEDEIEYLSI